MLEEIVTKILEAHGYIIVEHERKKDRVRYGLFQSSLSVEITVSQTYQVLGPEDKREALSKLIAEESKPLIREEALKILEEGSEKWNEWRKTHGQLDLDFSGLEMFKHNFSGCDLRGANFQNAMLISSNFENSILNGCHFENARLAHVNFQNADLTFIHAQNSVLNHANLEGANLSNAKLNYASLKHASLAKVVLHKTQMNGADLFKVNLQGANLSGALIDSETKLRGVKGVVFGINGIWSRETDDNVANSVG